MTDSTSGPSDIAIFLKLHALYQANPQLGAEKAHKQLLEANPEWVGKVSLKRVKTIRNENGLISQASGAPGSLLPSSGIPGSVTRNVSSLASTTSSRRPTLRPSTQISTLEHAERLKERLATASEALLQQNQMHDAARKAGLGFGGGWYGVLPDGQEEYVWEKVLWVQCAIGDGEEAMGRYAFLEKGKQEAILGNAAGVYLVYMGLRSALPEVGAVKRGEATVSDERLARQLEAEYGINPIPFGKAVDRNPESAEGKMLTNVLWDLAAH